MENKRNGKILREPAFEKVAEGIYNIMMPPAFNEYLVLGEERALLIDSGMGIGSIREIVEQITDLPITLINTHGHPDHAGGNSEFEPALMNPAEFDVYERMASLEFRIQDVSRMSNGAESARRLKPTGPAPIPVQDGERLDLGNRTLQVLYTPGHTHGSISIYDEKTGSLFNGDCTMANITSMAGEECSTIAVMADSLRRMLALHPVRVMGGHMPNINGSELIEKALDCCEDILNGARGEQSPGQRALLYEKNGVGIRYREDHIR